MWRSTERVSLEKKPSMKVEPGTVLGRENEFEAVRGLIDEPGSGLFGDVRGMIVEDQLDRGAGRVMSRETSPHHALVKDRHRSREFIEFLKLLDAALARS